MTQEKIKQTIAIEFLLDTEPLPSQGEAIMLQENRRRIHAETKEQVD